MRENRWEWCNFFLPLIVTEIIKNRPLPKCSHRSAAAVSSWKHRQPAASSSASCEQTDWQQSGAEKCAFDSLGNEIKRKKKTRVEKRPTLDKNKTTSLLVLLAALLAALGALGDASSGLGGSGGSSSAQLMQASGGLGAGRAGGGW